MTRTRRILLLSIITLLSIVVHGYHTGTDDAAIYAPGIKKTAVPSLYPFGSEFFMHHAGLSAFPHLVAAVTWLTRLPIEWSMLLWFAFAQFLLLWAAYELARQCFRSERARWAVVGLLAAVLSIPIADSYLTARSLSTPLVLMSAACFLGGRIRAACLWLLSAFLVHPQMAIYGGGIWIASRVRVPLTRACRVRGGRACASRPIIPVPCPFATRPRRLSGGAVIPSVLPGHDVALVGVGWRDRAPHDPGCLCAPVARIGAAGLP
jgi:hypothetical protein